jgi:2-haloacid dehalogenase
MAERPPIPVFDIGNVLIRWDPRLLYRRLIADDAEREDFLARICPPAWNLEMDAGKSFAQGVAERAALFPDKAELICAFDSHWVETLGGAVDGTVAVLEELLSKGVGTYAITNFNHEKFEVACGVYPFLTRFEGVIVSGRERMLKPDLRIFRLLCARYGLAAEDCFFIDDSMPNVKAAQTVGMRAHHFERPEDLRAALKAVGLPLA